MFDKESVQNFILKCADRNDNSASLENGVSYYKTEFKNDQIGFLKLLLHCHVIRNKLECCSMASACNFKLKSADRERDNYKWYKCKF